MPLSVAYQTAVAQFRSLKSELAVANSFAAQEAEAYGAKFGPTEVERGFAIEEKALQSWQPESVAVSNASGTTKRPWAPVWEGASSDEWTRGQKYTKQWKAGVLPSYKPPEAIEGTSSHSESLDSGSLIVEAVSQKRRSYG
jgi:small subunit ribosomal protein S23